MKSIKRKKQSWREKVAGVKENPLQQAERDNAVMVETLNQVYAMLDDRMYTREGIQAFIERASREIR